MSFPRRLYTSFWILGLIALGGLLVLLNSLRVDRLNYVSELAAAPLQIDASSPTGYEGGMRQLIVPEHNNESYEWIAQTQQMLAAGESRLRHVNYDNAPQGRKTYTASAYRWWLGLLGKIDHAVTNRPMGLSVERAALWADPLLQLLLLFCSGWFIARHFSIGCAALFVVGLVTLYPLVGSFLPGQPGHFGLSLMCIVGSVLPLLAAVSSYRPQWTAANARRHARLAAVFAGLGLWVNVALQLPVIVGIGVGGLLAVVMGRQERRSGNSSNDGIVINGFWRCWSLMGAATILVMFFVEYFPSDLGGWRASTLHPVYAAAWWGFGELLALSTASIGGQKQLWSFRAVVVLGFAGLSVAAVPLWFFLRGTDGIFLEPAASRLSGLAGGPVAENSWLWLMRDRLSLVTTATVLPLAVLGSAIWLWFREKKSSNAAGRGAVAFALGPILVAMAGAAMQLRWWNVVDLLALIVAVAALAGVTKAKKPGTQRAWGWGVVVAAAIPGLILVISPLRTSAERVVTTGELESLIERDLSQWLANRAGPGRAIILASPNLTTSIIFHGGSRGLGTPFRENSDGLSAALRIASATSPDEAHALVRRREVTHIILPSWDPALDEYARAGTNQSETSLIGMLHRWLPPRWLRPVPYQLARIPGFEGQSVVIFEVVEVQENAVALSYLAEYFVEMDRLDEAGSVSHVLEQSFPEDLSALVARARVASATRDSATLAKLIPSLAGSIRRADDEVLSADRRVSLAIVLADGKLFELAKAQVRRSFEELNESEWRSLTTVSLYRALLLGKIFQIDVPDPELRHLSMRLLPPEFREALANNKAR